MFKDEEADQMFIAVVLRIPNIHLFVERCKEHRRTIGALSKEDIENIETEISRLAKGGFFVNKNEPFGVRRLGALGRVDAGWHHSGREKFKASSEAIALFILSEHFGQTKLSANSLNVFIPFDFITSFSSEMGTSHTDSHSSCTPRQTIRKQSVSMGQASSEARNMTAL